eukprot:5236570-Prymnesium_polylepis.1
MTSQEHAPPSTPAEVSTTPRQADEQLDAGRSPPLESGSRVTLSSPAPRYLEGTGYTERQPERIGPQMELSEGGEAV